MKNLQPFTRPYTDALNCFVRSHDGAHKYVCDRARLEKVQIMRA